MTVRLDSIKELNAKSVYDMSYRRSFSKPKRAESDMDKTSQETNTDSLVNKQNEPAIIINFDSLYQAEAPSGKAALLVRAKSNIESVKADYYLKRQQWGMKPRKSAAT